MIEFREATTYQRGLGVIKVVFNEDRRVGAIMRDGLAGEFYYKPDGVTPAQYGDRMPTLRAVMQSVRGE